MSTHRRDPRGAALGAFLAVLTSLLVMALILEAGMRILPIPGASPVVTINEPDPELGWVKRPGESTDKQTAEYDVTFSINSLGLRDDENLTRAKPEGVQRVLVVGDSFVLGYTVSRDDLFVEELERALREDRRAVQVLNGGTEGYATDQELLWLRREGLSFEPDVVVFCFYQNDVYWNGQTEYAGKPKPRFPGQGDAEAPEPATGPAPEPVGFWARHTALGGFFHGLFRSHRADILVPVGTTVMPREETVVLREPPPQLGIDSCWARTAACFRGLRKTCEDAGVKVLLTVIPAREQVHPEAATAYLERHALTADQVDFHLPSRHALVLARQAELPVLDPLPALKSAAAAGDPLYFEKDWHLNPAGNRVLAQALYERLTTPEFLGAAPDTPADHAAFTASAAPAAPLPRWPFVAGIVWLLLGTLYARSYRDESAALGFLKVGALVATVVGILFLFGWLAGLLDPSLAAWVTAGVLVLFVGFLLWKSRHHLGIIFEVYGSFVRQGHWYMIPLLVAMVTIGSLLIVASSSPFVAPFIYTLF